MGFYTEMFTGLIDKLNHEMTSYKTGYSSYGDPTGCIISTSTISIRAVQVGTMIRYSL